MPSLNRRAFVAGLLGLGITALSVVVLPGRKILCIIEDLLLRIDHELLIYNHASQPVVVDVEVTHPFTDAVTLSETVRLPLDGHACYRDPFVHRGNHAVEVAVRGGPVATEDADCCLFVQIYSDRIEFFTAFR